MLLLHTVHYRQPDWNGLHKTLQVRHMQWLLSKISPPTHTHTRRCQYKNSTTKVYTNYNVYKNPIILYGVMHTFNLESKKTFFSLSHSYLTNYPSTGLKEKVPFSFDDGKRSRQIFLFCFSQTTAVARLEDSDR